MYEETGATKIKVTPVCVYKEMEEIPKEYEMSKIMLSDELPANLTYPDTFKLYFKTVKEKMHLN